MLSVAPWVLAVVGLGGEAEPEDVVWVAPAGCPTAADVVERLGDGPRLPLRAAVTVDELGAAVRIEVDTSEGTVVRELALDSCAAAAEAVVLVHDLAVAQDVAPLAQATDAEHVEPEERATPEEQPTQGKQPAEKDSADQPGPAEPRGTQDPAGVDGRPQRWPGSLALIGDGAFAVGSLPSLGGLMRLGLRLDRRRLLLGLRAEHVVVRRIRRGELGADVSAMLGGLMVATRFVRGQVELHPRVGVLVGALRARGRGGVDPETRWIPWLVADVAVGVVWMVSRRVGLRASAELRAPLVRHRLTFDTTEIAQTSRVGGVFAAGVEVRFDLQASR